jgi:hypothetical protein
MGTQIVRQPDGKFALWSSVVDDFTVVDCEDEQEIIDVMVEDARKEITKTVAGIVESLRTGGKPYKQFTKSFDECVHVIVEIHGTDAESLRHFGLNHKSDMPQFEGMVDVAASIANHLTEHPRN